MGNAAATASLVPKIWEKFVCGQNDGLRELRPVVRESWLRCKGYGVDVRRRAAPSDLTSGELAGLRENDPLFETATPLLRMVLKALDEAPVLVTLADAHGRLLESVGCHDAQLGAEEINAKPGSRWTEEQMGTDAVPTCLAVDAPVQITGFENYVEAFHDWVGNAAPIHAPFTNRLLGAVGLYGYRDIPHLKGLELAVDLAATLERHLVMKEIAQRFSVFEQYEQRRRKFPNDALMGISRSGNVFVASPGALGRLGVPWTHLESGLSLDHLGISEEFLNQEHKVCDVSLRARTGELLSATLLPVNSDRSIAGFVAILRGARRSEKTSSLHLWPARHTFADLLGESTKHSECVARARRIALRDGSVLITGEPGTGKELLAHAIHHASDRNSGPFVPINCGGLNDELLGAELFGYSDGAFTGASKGGRVGKFELADRGTLFLDEAEAMSPAMQVHLLRAIEEQRITRIGADKPLTIDVRVIAATNADLETLVSKGIFRRDVYDRISCLSLEAPPLRERPNDIPLLLTHFLEKSWPRVNISASALERLENYCWPGNVRQLHNVLDQAINYSTTDEIGEVDLPKTVCARSCRLSNSCPHAKAATDRASVSQQPCNASERDDIVKALDDCKGNISEAALCLGIHRVSLHRKMKKYKVTRGYR